MHMRDVLCCARCGCWIWEGFSLFFFISLGFDDTPIEIICQCLLTKFSIDCLVLNLPLILVL